MKKSLRRRSPVESSLAEEGALHPLLARVYSARGVTSTAELNLALDQLLPPADLLNADRAAVLLADALAEDRHMLVVGDFDADGATSTALAVTALRAFGAGNVGFLVPNRFEYGYGLTPEIVELATRERPELIITVDNGISSFEGVEAARDAGIATLVTDHHLAGDHLPPADVIVNPNQPGCDFASKHLAGVGVIFYIMLSLRAELRRRGWFSNRDEVNLGHYLDLVALGTVADVVPLDRNNRILVAAGLARIRSGKARPGIRALLEVASRRQGSVVASDLGFAVGPRINAAGRLDDMTIGIDCLMSEDEGEAASLAARLHQLNQDRRVIEQGMQNEAMQFLASLSLDGESEPPVAMTLYREGWHQGVIGILASRIKDRLHRPVIAFADGDEGELKGSARSIPGIHIRDILDAIATRHPGLVTRFGGHAMAAGLSLRREAYDEFSAALVDEVTRHAEDVELQAVIESDGELTEEELDLEVATTLRYAGPWGQHFPEPLFDGEFEIVSQRLVGDRHLKLVLSRPGSGKILDAIAFNVDRDRWPDPAITRVDLAYRLDVNEYRGRRSLQLLIEHLVPR